MILVHSSTVAATLCLLPATSNPKTVRGMCYAILDVARLKSHHGTNINNCQSEPRSMCYTVLDVTGLKSHCGAK